MLSRHIVRASPFRAAALPAARRLPFIQQRTFLPDSMVGKSKIEEKYPDSDYPKLTAAEDPDMNGGYINPPRVKRQFRDPHADWWDKQERRNFGEPVHEDHDILGIFSTWEYTWVSTGKGLFQIGVFVAVFLSVCYGVKLTYSDRTSYPREFEGGLERELGGAGAARMEGDEDPLLSCLLSLAYCFSSLGATLHSHRAILTHVTPLKCPIRPTPSVGRMRYEDWDIILFPNGRDSKIPFKEFKVACHAVPDLELAHIHGAVGMPAMTCFIPSLAPGTPFQISIHCWRRPDLSQFTRTYSKHTDLVKFEARILVDGRLVASTVLDREVNGPHLITSTCEFTKTGELERLRFPHFRRELLFQNHWRPGDDIGRIKVVISEGFPRDSLSAPIERVKNVVAFSFQHAPLEILENNAIAWPNQSMWQCAAFNPAIPVPTYHLDDGPSSHAHSPRRKSVPLRHLKNQGFPAPAVTNAVFRNQAGAGLLDDPTLQMPYLDDDTVSINAPFPDPFGDSAYREWANSLANGQPGDPWDGLTFWPQGCRKQRQAASDTIMPDYVSAQIPEAMHISGPSLEDEPMSLKAPTNTPTGGTDDGQDAPLQTIQHITLPSDFASSLTRSLLNQPFPLPAHHHNQCKDNQHAVLDRTITVDTTPTVSVASGPSCAEFGSIMASLGCDNSGSSLATPSNSVQTEPSSSNSQVAAGVLSSGKGMNKVNSGIPTKRSRNFTPASVKAIDEEDEPRRASPHVRGTGFGGMESSVMG
ncbi:NADH dehydrogenase-like protein [Chaetomium fimeti]|uniref:NADH dehydrogenase-like protein n=1 Tax=Chaetomium fimeti TaxID=1854472 RepID=A0AAE0H8U7_9PEZI|nr:NADH dehydrogenase-like protein [Chaetomium fimeti]